MDTNISHKNDNIKKWTSLILNDIVLSIAIYFFLISTNLNTGGMDGVAMLMSKFVPPNFFSNSFSNISVFIFLAQVISLLVGWKAFGKEFFAKTAFLVVILIVSAPLFDLLTGNNSGILFDSLHIRNMYVQLVIASLMSGLLIGTTVANIRNHGYTTGGMDVFHKLLKDKFKINFIIILFMTDGVLVSVDSLLKSMENKDKVDGAVLLETGIRLLLSYITITIIGYIMEKKNKINVDNTDQK
ncbi:YitT family protein [Candidatus Phytoplasma pruni]|uniref:YitT family protein n=1 Tax=Candidatus Phytoplasma pruni TaxID=479893 RepID=A0A851HHL7_9MOLU|nr:YitT family protein [Candidatus Phytoplasma pruni]NWN46080.1 YitT family protein [Candidatus Phytoplasma pruni]